MNARHAAIAGFVALLLLLLVWRGLWSPPNDALQWTLTSVLLAPLLAPALLLLRRRPSALFWIGVCSLWYFCHGVMEAWSDPAVRGFALAEALLAVFNVLAVGQDGWQRRQQAKARAKAGHGL